MTRGALSVSLDISESPFFTDGSELRGTVLFDARKHELFVGPLTVMLTVEERLGRDINRTIVASKVLPDIPPKIDRGGHAYLFSLPISRSLAEYSPSLHVKTKNGILGVVWMVEVRSEPSIGLNATTIVEVYPSRSLSSVQLPSERSSYRRTSKPIQMIASLDAAEPHKPRAKLFVMLFGPSYRNPKNGELLEVPMNFRVGIPASGVFQSPSKSQIRLDISTAAADAVVLSQCFVKLISSTLIKATGQTYTQKAEIWERELDIVLPRGKSDFSPEIGDLELPTCAETSESAQFLHKYEICFTFVLRALNMENLTRWVSVTSPLTILPTSLAYGEELPPYVA